MITPQDIGIPPFDIQVVLQEILVVFYTFNQLRIRIQRRVNFVNALKGQGNKAWWLQPQDSVTTARSFRPEGEGTHPAPLQGAVGWRGGLRPFLGLKSQAVLPCPFRAK